MGLHLAEYEVSSELGPREPLSTDQHGLGRAAGLPQPV